VDYSLGLLFAFLERTGLSERTSVILLSDHGTNLPAEVARMPVADRKSPAEGNQSIPLLLRCPWRPLPKGGQGYEGFVEASVDLFPTVVQLTEVGAKPAPYAASFLPDMAGRFAGKPQAISESMVRGRYELRVVDHVTEYLKIVSLENGETTEQVRKRKQPDSLTPNDPVWLATVERCRTLAGRLDLFEFPRDGMAKGSIPEGRAGHLASTGVRDA
jgi:arylsulfatase A-like enzyme